MRVPARSGPVPSARGQAPTRTGPVPERSTRRSAAMVEPPVHLRQRVSDTPTPLVADRISTPQLASCPARNQTRGRWREKTPWRLDELGEQVHHVGTGAPRTDRAASSAPTRLYGSISRSRPGPGSSQRDRFASNFRAPSCPASRSSIASSAASGWPGGHRRTGWTAGGSSSFCSRESIIRTKGGGGVPLDPRLAPAGQDDEHRRGSSGAAALRSGGRTASACTWSTPGRPWPISVQQSRRSGDSSSGPGPGFSSSWRTRSATAPWRTSSAPSRSCAAVRPGTGHEKGRGGAPG